MAEHQKEFFSLAASGTAPMTVDDVCFDDDSTLPVPLESDAAQGPAVSSDLPRQDEQRADRVRDGQLQSSDEPQRAEEGTSRRNGGQLALLHVPEWWEEHWKGMPDYKQEDFMPYKSLTVHFETKEDMEKFSVFIGQKMLPTTKSIWYPEAEIAETAKLRWITSPKVEPSKKDELREILEGP